MNLIWIHDAPSAQKPRLYALVDPARRTVPLNTLDDRRELAPMVYDSWMDAQEARRDNFTLPSDAAIVAWPPPGREWRGDGRDAGAEADARYYRLATLWTRVGVAAVLLGLAALAVAHLHLFGGRA